MDIKDVAISILEGKTLQEKLIPIDKGQISFNTHTLKKNDHYILPLLPGRESRLLFSDKKIKFPRITYLKEEKQIGLTFHFFANHELIAIEMFAAALIIFPHRTPEEILFKKGILSALIDEQKHFLLYLHRMREMGVDFGDYPISGNFWKFMKALDTPQKFMAVMSLTFESANLDFAAHYAQHFKEIGDQKSFEIMETVLRDEISHVSLGYRWLKKWHPPQNLWSHYRELLPPPLTPARAKGHLFNEEARVKAGICPEFISQLKDYLDPYPITFRREWKKKTSMTT